MPQEKEEGVKEGPKQPIMPKPSFYIRDVPFFWGGDDRKKLTEEGMNFKFEPDDILVAGFPRSGKHHRADNCREDGLLIVLQLVVL